MNILQLERMYKIYVALENIEHSDVVFAQYLKEYGENICDDDCDITYVDGKFQCSEYSRDNDGDDEEESVPFL